MREIKFRAWDTKNERMVCNPFLFAEMQAYQVKDYLWTGDFVYYKDWIDWEDGIDRPCYLMQYTGLKDKNGKEIWEGDILKTRGRPYWDVIFKKGCFYIRNEEKNVEWSKSFEGIHFPHYEVIGNIYENPNLLNSEQNVQASVATGDDSSNEVDKQKIIADGNQNK